MNTIFVATFGEMLSAVIKIFFVAFIAGLLVRRDIIKKEYVKGFSELTIKVLLPALVFTNVVNNFSPETNPQWWILPVVAMLLPVFVVGITFLLFLRTFKEKLNIFSIAAFQNAGYLVLPIGQILYPGDFDQFALYVFLYILGFNPALWSLGKVLVTRNDKNDKFKLTDILTPPLVANIIAIVIVFAKVNSYIPEIIMSPISLLGSATVPMATFILGATLGSISIRKAPPLADIIRIMTVKYFVIPAITIIIIIKTPIRENEILSNFLIIEAAAAPAANLILMVRKYGGNSQTIGNMMLIGYILSIIIMPLWLAILHIF